MNQKKIFNGFYCQKCNSIPLIEILPDNKNTSIFFFCKCHKNCLSIDLFNRNYYRKNIEKNKITKEINNIEFNKINFLKNKNEGKKYINNIIEEYQKTKDEFYKFSKCLKDNLVNSLMLKIKKINDAYEKHLLINKKIENILDILIESYKIIDDNIINIKNIIINSSFNKKSKKTYLDSTYDFIFSYFQKEFIIQSPEQLKNVQRFYNHLKGVNCFLDYKINNEYYGISSSFDSNIAFYDLIGNKHLFTFCADINQVNWITISSKKNVISCGSDYCIKVWPIINSQKILELQNLNGRQVDLSPIFLYKCEDIINRIELISNDNKKNDILLGCSKKSIFLFSFNYPQDNFINNESLNIIAQYNNERIYNYLFLKTKINNDFVCAFSDKKIFLLNYPKLEKIKENNKLKISLINMNNCIQLNDNEILIIEFKLLSIINIIKFQKTFSIRIDGVIDCITKLRDGTILQGGQKGIKRYLQHNFKEILKLNDGYEEDYYEDYFNLEDELNELECILCIKELLDGRIVFCYLQKGIIITKLNIF